MQQNKQKVLVTGGSGFLGSHVADALTRNGYAVRIFDREPSPYISAGQEMIVGDINDPEAIMKAMESCTYVYHFAGIADLEEAKKNVVETARINILGTLSVLECAREMGIKRFVFASTIYVYSDRGGFYRASKQSCENFIETFEMMYGLPYTILRYGSLYGRRAGSTNGIYKLIKSALEDGEIVYGGDENAMREYIHVADAAQLSVDILGEDFKNRHIILTGNERLKIVDVMRMISEMLPNKPEIRFGEKTLAGNYAMTPYSYNPRLGHKLTGNSSIDLGQGLLDCIDEIAEVSRDQKPGKRSA